MEVVAILQATDDTRCNGIYVLEHSGILDTDYVVRHRGVDIIVSKEIGKFLCYVIILAANSQISESLVCNLLSMTWSAERSHLPVLKAELCLKIL